MVGSYYPVTALLVNLLVSNYTIENVRCLVAANFVAWKTVRRMFTRKHQKVLVLLCCTMSFVWHFK
jgi:hypothetical protein